ncbi:MAG TPA: alpha-L-arabinofuranosidase C-terminal domain-containing protein [Bacteroidota bacterium]|nr:alpha-L-arabinofuranosidase C-terminal domain-containing protein [Bacteroidota bacterium]
MRSLIPRPRRFFRPVLWLLMIPALSASGQTRVVVEADLARDTISRNIYGHFSEHLGKCIYGGYYVGEGNTKIPNTRGIRTDVVDALRKLKIPNLRWPGGCFADTYHWKDGIGPRAKRPAIVNSWWGGVTEDNSFGTHEFLDLCEQLGADPYITGNVGSGTVQDFAQWVQYTNFDGVSPMSALRKENGREKPWHVRFWGVGNEAWGCGGNMTAEYYVNLYKMFATFIPASWGPGSHWRVASGAGSSDYHWTEVLMRDIPAGLIEGLALHHYAVDWNHKGSATDFTDAEYFDTMTRALQMEELIQKHGTIMDMYDPKKKIALVVDEWGGWYDVEPGTNPGFLFQQNTMRDAMIAGVTLNIFNNHCDRVRMANLAQTVNVLQAVVLTEGERMIVTPTYHVMEMYTVHHDALLLPASVRGAVYAVGEKSLPAVSVSASRDASGAVHVSLVNIDASGAQDVIVEMRGAAFTSVSGRILSSAKVQDHNTFDDPARVQPVDFRGARLDGRTVRLQLPPCSVVVLALK